MLRITLPLSAAGFGSNRVCITGRLVRLLLLRLLALLLE